MAEIDKTLPNVKQPEDVVNETEENIDIVDEAPQGPVEITEDETGATIDFDPTAMEMPDQTDFYANLNDLF